MGRKSRNKTAGSVAMTGPAAAKAPESA